MAQQMLNAAGSTYIAFSPRDVNRAVEPNNSSFPEPQFSDSTQNLVDSEQLETSQDICMDECDSAEETSTNNAESIVLDNEPDDSMATIPGNDPTYDSPPDVVGEEEIIDGVRDDNDSQFKCDDDSVEESVLLQQEVDKNSETETEDQTVSSTDNVAKDSQSISDQNDDASRQSMLEDENLVKEEVASEQETESLVSEDTTIDTDVKDTETVKRRESGRKIKRPAVYDDDEVPLIKKKMREFVDVVEEDDHLDHKPYQVPFEHGWKREIVNRSVYTTLPSGNERVKPPRDIYYYTPTGKKLRSMNEISDFIRQSKSKNVLSDANFTFKKVCIYQPPEEWIRDAGIARGRSSANSSPNVGVKTGLSRNNSPSLQTKDFTPDVDRRVKSKSGKNIRHSLGATAKVKQSSFSKSTGKSSLSLSPQLRKRAHQPTKRFIQETEKTTYNEKGKFGGSSNYRTDSIPKRGRPRKYFSEDSETDDADDSHRLVPSPGLTTAAGNSGNFSRQLRVTDKQDTANDSPSLGTNTTQRQVKLKITPTLAQKLINKHKKSLSNVKKYPTASLPMLAPSTTRSASPKLTAVTTSATPVVVSHAPTKTVPAKIYPRPTVKINAPPYFTMTFRTPQRKVEKPCDMKCPGLEGVEPDLLCNSCMCLFHTECVNFIDSAGTVFVCHKCNGNIGKNTVSEMLGGCDTFKRIPGSSASSTPLIGFNPTQSNSSLPALSSNVMPAPVPHAGNSSTMHHIPKTSQNSMFVRGLPMLRRAPQPASVIPQSQLLSVTASKPVNVLQTPIISQRSSLPAASQLLNLSRKASAPLTLAYSTPKFVPPKILPKPTVTSDASEIRSSTSAPRPAPIPAPTPAANSAAQVITLPKDIAKNINKDKALCLKVNSKRIVIPPSCILSTSDGIKVCVPSKTFDTSPSSAKLMYESLKTHQFSQNDLSLAVLPSDVAPNENKHLVPIQIISHDPPQPVVPSISPQQPVINIRPKTTPGTDSNVSDSTQCNTVSKRPSIYDSKVFKRVLPYGKVNPALCFVKNLQSGNEMMIKIFSYLGLVELLRCSCVCQTWSKIVKSFVLWDKVNFSGVRITDWSRAQLFLVRARPSSISFRDMLLSHNIQEMFENMSDMIQWFKHQTALQSLDLGLVPAYVLQPCTSLRSLKADIERSVHTILDMRRLMPMPNLEKIELSKSPAGSYTSDISVKCLESLSSHTKLKEITLLGITPMANRFSVFSTLTNLKYLTLTNCTQFTEETYMELQKCSQLTYLHLECSGSNGVKGLSELLKTLSILDTLKLQEFEFDTDLCTAISNLSKLQALKLWPEFNDQPASVNIMIFRCALTLKTLESFEWGILPLPDSDSHSHRANMVPLLSGDNDDPESTYVSITSIINFIQKTLTHTNVIVYRVVHGVEIETEDATVRYALLRRAPEVEAEPELDVYSHNARIDGTYEQMVIDETGMVSKTSVSRSQSPNEVDSIASDTLSDLEGAFDEDDGDEDYEEDDDMNEDNDGDTSTKNPVDVEMSEGESDADVDEEDDSENNEENRDNEEEDAERDKQRQEDPEDVVDSEQKKENQEEIPPSQILCNSTENDEAGNNHNGKYEEKTENAHDVRDTQVIGYDGDSQLLRKTEEDGNPDSGENIDCKSDFKDASEDNIESRCDEYLSSHTTLCNDKPKCSIDSRSDELHTLIDKVDDIKVRTTLDHSNDSSRIIRNDERHCESLNISNIVPSTGAGHHYGDSNSVIDFSSCDAVHNTTDYDPSYEPICPTSDNSYTSSNSLFSYNNSEISKTITSILNDVDRISMKL